MKEKTKIMMFAKAQEYLFNLRVTDNTNSILVNLHGLEVTLKTLLPDYESIKDDFVEITDYDLKNLKQRVDKIRQYIREIDREVTVEDGKALYEMVNIIFETYVNEWGDKVYKLNRLEHEAFYLAKGSKYEEAIPKFQKYLKFMNNNPFLYIKIWLAHDEYVECLHQCRNDLKYYDTYVEALRENIKLYEPCHKRLQKKSIRAKEYLNEIVKN